MGPNKSPEIIADDSCKIWVQKIANTIKEESEDSDRIVKMADVTGDLKKGTGDDSGFLEEVDNSVKETEDFFNVNSVEEEEDPHVDSIDSVMETVVQDRVDCKVSLSELKTDSMNSQNSELISEVKLFGVCCLVVALVKLYFLDV